MKKTCIKNGAVALFTLLFSTSGALSVSALQSNPTTNNSIQDSQSKPILAQSNVELAQGLIGQCRAAKKRIFVYTERSTSSQTITTLAPNQEVTLAGDGSSGWIAISAPETGYVQAMDLKLCNNATQPDSDSTANLCRRVTVPEGLSIRQSPSPNAARVGGVFVGNTVKLATPRQSQKDSQGRTWIQITAPRSGWVSSGFPEGNLSPAFTCR
jgi:hypothetical protein